MVSAVYFGPSFEHIATFAWVLLLDLRLFDISSAASVAVFHQTAKEEIDIYLLSAFIVNFPNFLVDLLDPLAEITSVGNTPTSQSSSPPYS